MRLDFLWPHRGRFEIRIPLARERLLSERAQCQR